MTSKMSFLARSKSNYFKKSFSEYFCLGTNNFLLKIFSARAVALRKAQPKTFLNNFFKISVTLDNGETESWKVAPRLFIYIGIC